MSRRFSATVRRGWPGMAYDAVLPSSRAMTMSPPGVSSLTEVIPGPAEGLRVTETFSLLSSQAAMRLAGALLRGPTTVADRIRIGYWSKAAVSSARHKVSRVQVRSVSPGEWWMARTSSALMGSELLAASVMRRSASCPRTSSPGVSGALLGHHMTTGESGSSIGRTTDSACSRTSPDSRSTMTSPGTSSARWMSASSRSVFPAVFTTSTRRHGCSRAAVCAAAYALANERCSAATMSVRTSPEALPRRLRALSSALAISLVSVCVSVMIMGLLGPPPGVAVTGDHLVGAGRAPRP